MVSCVVASCACVLRFRMMWVVVASCWGLTECNFLTCLIVSITSVAVKGLIENINVRKLSVLCLEVGG